MQGLRIFFYLLVYAVTILSGVDLFVLAITAPMFLAILASLLLTHPHKVGYIDGIALVFFLAFVIVPLQQISNYTFVNSDIGRGYPYPRHYYLIVAALALFAYAALVPALWTRRQDAIGNRPAPVIPAAVIVALAIILPPAAVVASGSLENLIAPRYFKVSNEFDFAMPIIIAMLSLNAMFAFLRREANPLAKYGVAAVACLALLIVTNPFNSARFFLLGAWIPAIVCAFPWLLRPGRFYLVLPFIVLIAVPVLSITSRFQEDRIARIGDVFERQGSVFAIANFDIFESGCEAIRYVDRFGREDGGVFVSTVFTFVPRSMWPEKPINSGLLIGYMNADEGLGNQNLAVPWFMDGYIDFGIVGSLVFSVLLAAAFGILRRTLNYKINGIDLYLLVFLANIAILVRGTLAVTMILFLFQIVLLAFALHFLQRREARGAKLRAPMPQARAGRRSPRRLPN